MDHGRRASDQPGFKRQRKQRPALAFVVLVAVVLVALFAFERNEKEKADQAYIEQCRRANVTRAFLRRGEVDPDATRTRPEKELAKTIFPILACDLTIENDGRPVPLSPEESRHYIELVVMERRLPILRRGTIYGSDDFER